MIFYGTRSTLIKEGKIRSITCPNCTTNSTMHYGVYGKYAHVYWIPTFPYGKVTVAECDSCKKTYKLKELPNSIKEKINLDKSGTRYPLWYFSGLAVLFAVLFSVGYSVKLDNQNNEKYINNPQIGDVFSIKLPTANYYTCAKIKEITKDSVFLNFNKYEINKRSKISKIDKAENYDSLLEGYSKAELLNLFKEEIIYDIER